MRYLILMMTWIPSLAAAQGLEDVDWSLYSFPIQIDDGKLAGTGGEMIIEESKQVQFLLFGEEHGVDRIPDVVAATYATLYQAGFQFLALEMGPWFADRVSRVGVDVALESYPHSLAFDYDGTVDLLKIVESRFKGTGDAFWGLDQSVTAIHPFARLAQILPTAHARRAARGLFLKSALQAGEYLPNDHSADLKALRGLAGPQISDEAALILDSLETSMKIYVAYRTKEREHGIWISDILREQYMMARLDTKLAEAVSDGIAIPKVIFQMGGAHLMRGVGPNGVTTLGEHAEKVAGSNGLGTFHIAIRSYRPDSLLPESIFASDSNIAMIDAEPIRSSLPLSDQPDAERRLIRDLRQFDAIIYLRDSDNDDRDVVRQYEVQFKRSLLTKLSIIAVPLLAIFSICVPTIRQLWSLVTGEQPRCLAPFGPWVFLLLASVGLTVAAGLQVTRLLNANHPALSSLSTGNVASVIQSLAATVTVGLIVVTLWKRWWPPTFRLHFMAVSAGILGLVAFMSYWNFGAMVGW